MTKYITNTEIKLLNDKAIRLNFNRAISDDFVKELKNLNFPNKTSINKQDITAYLDIEIKDYDILAEV